MNSGHFKTIFSKRLGCLVAVGEHTSSQGKANGAASGQFSDFAGSDWLSTVLQFVGVLTASCALVSLAWAGPVATAALPTGGQVAQGAAAISQSGAVMNITQSTPKAVVNWNTFDIGQNAQVNIVQPSASAVMLNRVTSANPSQILGQLNANGQVVLVNPNGVLFGKDGSVNANSFTASTLGITDANFMAGNQQFERNGSTAGVVNQGSIKTTGGYVALLGASVSNEGKIETQGGTAYLAAAETVKIPVSGSGRIKLELSPSSINAAVSNAKGGTIVTEGGQVYMQAASLSTMVASIIQSGSIDTTGEQGGAVHLLTDGGQIKVDGSIKANSTGKDEQGQQRKGASIVVGRDEDTGSLAKSTDVSGAQFESKGGFVETSGEYLKTDGISVNAAEWFLDPSDITISSATNANVTGTSPADITPNGSTGTSSIIQASTITGAINNGTSVTIKTTNASNTTGAGNITISSALAFSNSTADATLSLIADNGITQNAAISAAGSKLVNISMTANGNYQGNTAASANSQGIVLNSTISTNGSVTLNGTNNNTGSGAGVRFASGSGITAASYTVNGTKLGTAGNGYGVWFTGTSTLTSSGASVINGVSNSANGAFTAGLMFDDSTTVTLDAGVGSLVAKGSNSAYQTGVRIAANGNNSTRVTTKGTVTLGSNDTINTGFMLRSGVLTADSGALTILGKTSTGGDGVSFYDTTGTVVSNNGVSITANGASTSGKYGVYFGGTSINAGTTGDIAITGNSVGNDGIRNSSNLRLTGKNITLTGTSDTTGQTGKYGIQSIIGPGSGNVFTAAGNINISGTVTGTGTGGGLYFVTTSWQSLINTMTAGGSIIFNGINDVPNPNTYLVNSVPYTYSTISLSGVQATAGGSITLNAITNNAASTAINISSAGLTTGLGYQGGSSSFVSSGGNVLIQSNQGGIFLGDQNSTTSRAISGKYVFIDNTGGTIDANNVLNAGAGSSTTVSGVQFNDTRAITASASTGNGIQINGVSSSSGPGVNFSNTVALNSPNLLINGVSATNAGVYFGTGATLTSAGTVTATGRSTSGSGLQFSSASLGITAANASLTGTSSTGNGIYSSAALNMNVSRTATFNGTSSSLTTQQGGISFQGAVSNAASNGGIAITSTDTAGGNNWAYYQNGALSSGTGGITINATGSGSSSALGIYGNITSTGAVSLTGNAGTGVGNGIWTSGTVGISGTSVTMNGTGGTTNGAGAYLNVGTTVTASSGDVSITGSKPSSTSTAAINFAGTINGVSTKNVNLTGGLTGAGSIVTNGAAVNFNNTLTATDTSTVVISGTGSVRNQTGLQTLNGTNTYTGSTTITGGTLQIGNGGSAGTLGTGAVSVAAGSNLNFYRNDAALTIGNNITSSGTINFLGTGVTGQSGYALTGSNANLGGSINVSSSRLGVTGTTQLGTASINVNSGASLWENGNFTLSNSLTLAGNGWTEGFGNLGALRLQNGAVHGGNITLAADARIGAYGSTGTISGAISGTGKNLEFNNGTVTLTGTNTYSGTTNIASGTTLNIGSGGTSGSISNTSAITDNGALVFNRTDTNTVSGSISGTGTLTQSGSGTTILAADNTYQGVTTVSNGTLQIGNSGSTGTLGTGGAVALSNGANLNFVRNANTSIDNTISGNGNVNANITGTGSNLTLNNSITLSGATGSQTNNAILSTTGSISQAAGKTLTAKNLFMTASSSTIGASNQRINTSVDFLSLNSAGSQFVTEVNAVTVAAQTTSNGNIDITTTNGTLSAGGVTLNSIVGVNAKGDVKLTGNNGGTSGHGLALSGTVSATGDLYLNGTTSSSTNGDAGIFSASGASASAKNIYMVAGSTTDTSVGRVLGFYGAGGVYTSSEKLDFQGSTNSAANGFYAYENTFTAGKGITIRGTSKYGQGVGFDNAVQLTNTTGNIQITGTATDTSKQAIGLQGSSITNNGGDIVITAVSGNFGSGVGNPGAWGGSNRTNNITSNGTGKVQITAGNGSAANSGTVDGTILAITQNGNGGVLVSTSGTGNVTAPKITHAGSGNVVLAAGTSIAAGTGAGGQVKTVSGNTVSSAGKTLVFTGTLADTGVLSNLHANLTDLYASDVGATQRNLTGNKAYDSGYSITNGAQAQAIFRQAIDLGTVNFSATVTKTYGDTGYTKSLLTGGASQLKADLGTALAALASSDTVTQSLIASAASNIKFNKSTLIQQMALNSTDWNDTSKFSTSNNRKVSASVFNVANPATSDFTLTTTGTVANLQINQKSITTAQITSTGNTYGDPVVAGNVNLGADVITNDVVTASAIVDGALQSVNKSSSGNLKAGTYGQTVATTALSSTDAGNYKLDAPVTSANSYTVAQKSITTAQIASAGNTYGGTVAAGGASLGGDVITGDVVTAAATVDGASQPANKSGSGNLKAGTYGQTVATTALSSTDAGNYKLDAPVTLANSYTVAQMTVSGSIDSVTTTYGNNAATGGVNLIGVIGNDQVSPSGSSLSGGVVSSSGNLKAGTYVQTVGGGLSGADAGNYSFSGTSIANHVVNKLAITSQIADVTTTYGSVAQTGATSLQGVLLGDKVNLAESTGTLQDKALSTSGQLKAGTYKQLVSAALTGADADNYTAVPTTTSNYVVTPKAIAATVSAADKVYDGSKVATMVANSTGVVTGDVVAILGVTGTFASKNVVRDGSGNAVAQTVTVAGTGVGLGGDDGANYTLSNATNIASTTARITPKDLTAKIADVQTTYGQTAETGKVTLSGVLAGDAVQASAATLSDKSLSGSGQLKAGTYTQTVGTSLSGADAVNYNTAGASSQNYVVSKLVLATSIADVTTVYGTAAKTGLTSLQGVLAGDTVSLPEATLVDAANSTSGQIKAGTYKQTVGNALSGADAANYTATPTTVANYVVTPKAIAATVTAADKVYDGNNVATLTANSADILVGDVVNVQGATGTFASKNVARDGSGNAVAQAVTVSGTGMSLGGADGANYTLTNAASIASTTAKITPKDLSVTGITASDKVYDGSTTAAINTANAVVSGLVAGDSVSMSSQSGVGNLASKDVAFEGAGAVASQAVTVSGLSLNGADAVNYNVSDKSGASAKVLQRALNISGSVAQDKTVDGNTNAQVTPGQLGNLVAGETLVVTATGQFADAEIGTNKAVATQYALANGANGIAKNYTLASEVLRAAILVASINPVQPIVNPSRTGGGGRVVVAGSSSSGAALGVADGEEEIISREECSVLNPEKCECQESTIAGVEMCFAPTLAANSKN